MLAELIFWLSFGTPLYVYLGYPIVLMGLRRLLHRPVRRRPIEPFVSLLIPAYNEADVIEAKIRNSMASDYPADRLEIVIASDGSTDSTVERARSLSDGDHIRVLMYPTNRGKISILNDSVTQLRGEIVVFSDAAAMLYPDSIRQLVSNFADPAVGAASGLHKVSKPDESDEGKSENFYWKCETFLKVQESELASVIGGHGDLYAIRKELYPFPPPGTINDDYVIPFSVLGKGYRAVYDTRAVVYEEAQEMSGFARRVRIMAGNLQQLREIGALLRPLRPLPLFFCLSHKAGRLLVPFAMIVGFVANLFLLDRPFYLAFFCMQAAFYLFAVTGAVWRLKPKALTLPFYFAMINAAVFFAVYHALTRWRRMSWK